MRCNVILSTNGPNLHQKAEPMIFVFDSTDNVTAVLNQQGRGLWDLIYRASFLLLFFLQ